MRSRPAQARLVPGQCMKGIELPELPEAQPAERRSDVAVLPPGVLAQMRHRTRKRSKAIILQGEAYGAKQLYGWPKPFRGRGRDIVELQFDRVDRLLGFAQAQCQHKAPCSRKAPPDLWQRGSGEVLPGRTPPQHLKPWRIAHALKGPDRRDIAAQQSERLLIRFGAPSRHRQRSAAPFPFEIGTVMAIPRRALVEGWCRQHDTRGGRTLLDPI